MMMMGLTSSLLLSVLFGGHPLMLPARAAASAAAFAQHRYGLAPTATAAAEDLVLVELRDVKGLEATGRSIACRLQGEWQAGPSCDLTMLAGRELRVFTGAGGEVARWTVAEGQKPVVPEDGSAPTVAGTLSAPLPEADATDALRTPFALLGEARHLVEPPSQEGWSQESLAGVLDLGRRVTRMNRRMSEGLQVEQYAVFNLSPGRREVVAVAGSNYPTGPLDKAPLPSASILFVHDPTTTDWVRWATLQVISNPQDTRRFERYRLAAVLDVDGDGARELLVRANSALGERFRLFRLEDDLRLVGIAQWAGVVQASGAPTTVR